MSEIGLGETIDALRAELAAAVERARDTDIQFPVAGVQLEFHVGVKKEGEGTAGVKFWVLELGAGGATRASRSRRSRSRWGRRVRLPRVRAANQAGP